MSGIADTAWREGGGEDADVRKCPNKWERNKETKIVNFCIYFIYLLFINGEMSNEWKFNARCNSFR